MLPQLDVLENLYTCAINKLIKEIGEWMDRIHHILITNLVCFLSYLLVYFPS